NQLTGAAMSPLQYALQAEIDAGIALLRERQYADGSWSWVEGVEQGDPLVTAYAALALVEAEQAGFSQLRGVINSATAYVQRNMVPVGPNVPAWQLNRQAFYLYVLS